MLVCNITLGLMHCKLQLYYNVMSLSYLLVCRHSGFYTITFVLLNFFIDHSVLMLFLQNAHLEELYMSQQRKLHTLFWKSYKVPKSIKKKMHSWKIYRIVILDLIFMHSMN